MHVYTIIIESQYDLDARNSPSSSPKLFFSYYFHDNYYWFLDWFFRFCFERLFLPVDDLTSQCVQIMEMLL